MNVRYVHILAIINIPLQFIREKNHMNVVYVHINVTLNLPLIYTRIHTGENPYECSICLYKYNTKSSLTNHINVVYVYINVTLNHIREKTYHIEEKTNNVFNDIKNDIIFLVNKK